MKIYSKPEIVVLELKEDVITASNFAADNVVAGNSGWIGWSEGGLE